MASAQMVSVASTSFVSQQKPILRGSRALLVSRVPSRTARHAVVVRAEKKLESFNVNPQVDVVDAGQQDSYSRIEAPVRGGEQQKGNIPDGGPPVASRNNDYDQFFIQNEGSQEKDILGTEVALPDALRFKGAAPEVINSRLAMLGFVAAAGAELATGTPVWDQVRTAPGPIAATFLLIIVASLIPIVKGVPRKGGAAWGGLKAFTSDAELINGRLAMIGFVGLIFADWLLRR